jgi:hypothetical protein
LVGKLVCRQTIFGSVANPAHATATVMHFPANAGLIFLMDDLTNDMYLVDTGATLSIVPCNQNSSPFAPLLKGTANPLLGLHPKTAISRQTFHIQFFTSRCGPTLGIDFLGKFKVTVAPEIIQIQLSCTAAASTALYLPSAAPPASPYLFSFPPASAPVPIRLPVAVTSSQPLAISAHKVRNPKVKSSSFSSGENQSLSDPLFSFKKYLILCLLMSKSYCKNSSPFFAPGI